MKVIFFILSITVCFEALSFQQKMEIDSKIVVNGQPLGSPRILALEGQRARVMLHDQNRRKGYKLEVTPIRKKNQKVQVTYQLAIRERDHETLSRGQIILPQTNQGRVNLDQGRIQIFFRVKES